MMRIERQEEKVKWLREQGYDYNVIGDMVDLITMSRNREEAAEGAFRMMTPELQKKGADTVYQILIGRSEFFEEMKELSKEK